MKVRQILFRLLIALPLVGAALLTMWLIQRLPMYYGLLALIPWAIAWCWIKVTDTRRARRRQAERVTQSDPARWRWN
jgi:hypothetical protein